MWRNLLWSDGLEQSLHIVEVRHVEWGALGVVWVHISDLHGAKSSSVVVTGSVFSGVGWSWDFLLNVGHSLNLGLVGLLELGLNVISHGELSLLCNASLFKGNHFIQEGSLYVHFLSMK